MAGEFCQTFGWYIYYLPTVTSGGAIPGAFPGRNTMMPIPVDGSLLALGGSFPADRVPAGGAPPPPPPPGGDRGPPAAPAGAAAGPLPPCVFFSPPARVPGGRPRRCAARPDEDAVTLAAEAGAEALAAASQPPGSLIFASVTPPYDEGGSVQVLAELLGLPDDTW